MFVNVVFFFFFRGMSFKCIAVEKHFPKTVLWSNSQTVMSIVYVCVWKRNRVGKSRKGCLAAELFRAFNGQL